MADFLLFIWEKIYGKYENVIRRDGLVNSNLCRRNDSNAIKLAGYRVGHSN